MVTRAIYLVALAAFLFPMVACADDGSKLTGSGLKTEDAVAKSDAIFVGEITAIGFGDDKAKGESAYRGVQVKVLQVLRGIVHAPVTVTLHIIGVMDFHEDPPKVGSSYIFFIHDNDVVLRASYTVLKLLPATDDNIAKVKKLISN